MKNDPAKHIHQMIVERDSLRERIDSLESSIESAAINYDKLRIKASAFNTFEERMAILIDMKIELTEQEATLQKEISRVLDICKECMDPIQYHAVRLRMSGYTYEQIAKEVDYSKSGLYRLYKAGAREFAKKAQSEQQDVLSSILDKE